MSANAPQTHPTFPKRLRNPDLVIETWRWARPTKVYALCGIQFLPLRSTTISNWQLLTQTVYMQLPSRVAVLLATGWWESRHALARLVYRRLTLSGPPRRTNVRFWHKADMQEPLSNVRYWG